MNKRLEEFIINAGAPEFFAGFGTFIAGDAVTEFTNPEPGTSNIHEVIGLGVAGVAAIAAMGLVSYLRQNRASSDETLA